MWKGKVRHTPGSSRNTSAGHDDYSLSTAIFYELRDSSEASRFEGLCWFVFVDDFS
jgi:hypothetical protein